VSGELDDAGENPMNIARKLLKDPKGIPEKAANYLFESAAPKSNVRIKGFWLSSLFVFWYIASSSAMFASLFWHFYTGSCEQTTTLIDAGQNSSAYENIFASGTSYFCTSKMVTLFYPCGNKYLFECMLTGFTPDRFQSHFLCPPSNMKAAFTRNDPNYPDQEYSLTDWDAFIAGIVPPPFCSSGVTNGVFEKAYDADGFDGYCLPKGYSNNAYPANMDDAGPLAEFTYITCGSLSSVLATAGQCKF